MSKCGALVLVLTLVTLPGLGAQSASAKIVQQYWERAKQEEYKSPEELQAQNAREIRKGQFYRKLIRGDPNTKTVALTFDDGPHPQFTPQILAILKRYNVRATFFVVGKMAARYPELVRQEAAAGNLVGNHTYDHVNLTRIPVAMVEQQWQKGSDVIKRILGKPPAFCRPPGGDYDKDVINSAAAHGLTTVLWTDDPGDYARPGDKVIAERVLRRIDNGGIVLLHDGVQQTIDVLPQIIESLQKRGFRFVTVAEMIQVRAEAAPAAMPRVASSLKAR